MLIIHRSQLVQINPMEYQTIFLIKRKVRINPGGELCGVHCSPISNDESLPTTIVMLTSQLVQLLIGLSHKICCQSRTPATLVTVVNGTEK